MKARPLPTVRTSAGSTLVELLVVLAVMGVMLSIAGLAFHRVRVAPTAAGMALDKIAAARREAIASGHDVSTIVMLDSQPRAVTARADGSVLTDSVPAFDPLSGRPIMRDQDDERP